MKIALKKKCYFCELLLAPWLIAFALLFRWMRFTMMSRWESTSTWSWCGWSCWGTPRWVSHSTSVYLPVVLEMEKKKIQKMIETEKCSETWKETWKMLLQFDHITKKLRPHFLDSQGCSLDLLWLAISLRIAMTFKPTNTQTIASSVFDHLRWLVN